MIKRGMKGQLTIFIILAILIVAVVLFIFLFWPKLKTSGLSEIKNPYAYMEECIEDHIQETIEIITMNGGEYEINEQMSFLYRGEYIRFLCYTNENYRPCYKQYAFLTTHFENETLNNIREEVNACFDAMRDNYERDGYTVIVNDSAEQEMEVRIKPGFVSTKLGKELFLTKGDENQEFKNFELKTMGNLYDVLEVVKNILTWESIVGDSVSEAYMIENPYIKVDKRPKDNIKLYTVSHRETGEEFKFATRSFALPPGF